MAKDLSPADAAKLHAAKRAVSYVEDGMRVGLGTGSTAAWMVKCLGERVQEEGLKITGVATSRRTEDLARQVGIPVATLDETRWLDLTIDGADEYDPNLNLIKGGGGALLREKIVAAASAQMLVIADESKNVEVLGRFPLPIEVNRFGLAATQIAIEKAAAALDLSGSVTLRMTGGEAFVTDGGHLILDASFGRIPDTRALSNALHAIPGVVEHGLFLGLARVAILAGADGIRTRTQP
jgi:ribose 5-phosphate isomerase A